MSSAEQSSEPPSRVLAVAQRPSDYNEMRRCLIELHSRGYTAQLLYFCIGDIDAERIVINDIRELHAQRIISDVEIVGANLSRFGDGHPDGVKTLVDFIPDGFVPAYLFLRRCSYPLFLALAFLKQAFYKMHGAVLTLQTYRRNLAMIGKSLDVMRPMAIILPEDVVGAVTPLAIAAGHRRDIPSIIIPYTIANQQEAFRSLADQPNYQLNLLPNRMLGALLPRWVMAVGNTKLVRLPAPHILGHWLLKVQPPDPWMMNSGFANAIAVENEAMRDYYLKAGIPDSKLTVVGAFYDDHLAQYTNNRTAELANLRRELGIDNDKPILLIGGCPDQKHNAPSFEFGDMEEFCNRLGETLGDLKDTYEILVRPHPNYHRMGEVLQRHGIRMTMIDTARLVALCDIYIAFASATIRWAIACGKPTINYDVFHYEYDDFMDVGGVAHVREFAEFSKLLSTCSPGSSELSELTSGAAEHAAHWGNLDGKSGDRIVALIEDLSHLKPVPRVTQ